MVSANRAVLNFHVPGPKTDCGPLLDSKPFLALLLLLICGHWLVAVAMVRGMALCFVFNVHMLVFTHVFTRVCVCLAFAVVFAIEVPFYAY